MIIFPTIEACGTPAISKIAHSISEPTIAFSTMALESKLCASAIAAANWASLFTFVVPRDDPPRAGFTNTG